MTKKKWEILIYTVNLDMPNQSQLISPESLESGKKVHERRTLVDFLAEGWEPVNALDMRYGHKWVLKREIQDV